MTDPDVQRHFEADRARAARFQDPSEVVVALEDIRATVADLRRRLREEGDRPGGPLLQALPPDEWLSAIAEEDPERYERYMAKRRWLASVGAQLEENRKRLAARGDGGGGTEETSA